MRYKTTWFGALMAVLGTAYVFLIAAVPKETHIKTFCAYDRVFIEFTEGNTTWGTTLTDRYGRPIPCSDVDDLKSSTQYNKEII